MSPIQFFEYGRRNQRDDQKPRRQSHMQRAEQRLRELDEDLGRFEEALDRGTLDLAHVER